MVVGALLGRELSGNAVVAFPKNELIDDDPPDRNGDLYDRAESALIDFLNGHHLTDEGVVGRLIGSLRRSKRPSVSIVKAIDAAFRAENEKRPESVLLSSSQDNTQAIQQIFVPHESGSRGAVIVRYLSHVREQTDVHAFQQFLRSMEMSNAFEKDMFLRCIAQSHTPQELAEDTDTEFMIILEPFSGTLGEFLKDNEVGFHARLHFFMEVFAHVVRLSALKIPHRSDINEDTVLVKGNAADAETLHVVFSAGILSARSAGSIVDKFNEDVRQLGALLKLLLTEPWPADVRLRADVGLAFAKAMESGALKGFDTMKQELASLLRILASQHSTDDFLYTTRINYLRLAVDAVKSADTDGL